MPPATRAQPLPDVVYAAISAQILGGELATGDPLPSERLLAEEYEVNRHAIREAIKRLQQAGLVRVSHGGATRVLDWRSTGGLDLLTQLGRHDALGPELVRSGLEMRRSIGVDAARLCAERASTAQVAALERLVAGWPSADGAAADAYEQLWALIVDGSGNLAYRLSLNSLLSATGAMDLKALTMAEATDREAIATLVEVIAAGRAKRAGKLADQLLGRTAARSADRSSIGRAPQQGSPWSM